MNTNNRIQYLELRINSRFDPKFKTLLRLNRYKQEGKQFDIVINDLTAIPVDGSDTKEAEDLW